MKEDCDRADQFCAWTALEPARPLPSTDIDRIARESCNAWGLDFRITDPSSVQRETFQGTIHNQSKFRGTGIVIKVKTTKACKDCCLVNTLPFICGLYHRPPVRGRGVYFELTIQKMNGVIALVDCHFRSGYASLNDILDRHRLLALSALQISRVAPCTPSGRHAQVLREIRGGQESGFWEAIGGRPPAEGNTVGCGYEFGNGGTLFFTFNGERLVPDAFKFKGLYTRTLG